MVALRTELNPALFTGEQISGVLLVRVKFVDEGEPGEEKISWD